MKLYSYWRSSCSYRVRIGLALKGLEVEQHSVHLLEDGGRQRADAYRALNPMGQVPALELDDGTVLVQSLAILEYLDEVYPEPPLLPEDSTSRARVRAMAEVINSGTQPLQNLYLLQYVVREYQADKAEFARHFITRGMQALEAMAAADPAGDFLVGDSPTLADVCLVPQMYNVRRFGIDLERFPRLTHVEAVCAELEAFASAHPDRQPDAPRSES